MPDPRYAHCPMAAEVTSLTYAQIASVLDTLPDLVWKRRTHLGLGLRELARAIGMSAMVLSRCERGENVSLPNAIRLLHWLAEDPTP